MEPSKISRHGSVVLLDLSPDELTHISSFSDTESALNFALSCRTTYDTILSNLKLEKPTTFVQPWSLVAALHLRNELVLANTRQAERFTSFLKKKGDLAALSTNIITKIDFNTNPSFIVNFLCVLAIPTEGQVELASIEVPDAIEESSEYHLLPLQQRSFTVTFGHELKHLCMEGVGYQEDVFQIIHNTPNLESLILSTGWEPAVHDSKCLVGESCVICGVTRRGGDPVPITVPLLPNLKRLEIGTYQDSVMPGALGYILQLTPNLQDLLVEYHEESYGDDFLEYLMSHTPHLKKLTILSSYDKENYEEANPFDCGVSDQGLLKLLEFGIQELDIKYTELTGEFFTNIGENGRQIKVLSLVNTVVKSEDDDEENEHVDSDDEDSDDDEEEENTIDDEEEIGENTKEGDDFIIGGEMPLLRVLELQGTWNISEAFIDSMIRHLLSLKTLALYDLHVKLDPTLLTKLIRHFDLEKFSFEISHGYDDNVEAFAKALTEKKNLSSIDNYGTTVLFPLEQLKKIHMPTVIYWQGHVEDSEEYLDAFVAAFPNLKGFKINSLKHPDYLDYYRVWPNLKGGLVGAKSITK
jgi:hypothetical protein